MKVVFVRAPRFLWPIINESDNFLLPLNYPCLAAAIRRELPDVEIKIMDCLPMQMGWKSLRHWLEEEKPDVVGCGDEAVYQHEGSKVLRMAKELNPKVVTIAGGHFHSHVPEMTLVEEPVDYVVRFEGEITIVELLRAIQEGRDPADMPGIAYRRDNQVIINPPRPLIKNLDDLPFPAYDLMPVDKYAPFGRLWPRSATIEGSRGCVGNCKFCSLWTQMGNWSRDDQGNEKVTPCFRNKSVDRTFAEIEMLYHKYGRRYLFWIDPTWNANPKWMDELCEKILKSGMKFVGMWAFVRADFLVRDDELGILEKMVKAGFSHALIGVERSRDSDLAAVHKGKYTADLTRKCYEILRRKYPQVFRQGTFVLGLRNETRESLFDLLHYAIDLQVDYPAFHTLAPVPGTELWREARANGWIEIEDYSQYDWYTPIMPSEQMSREEIAAVLKEIQKRFVLYRPQWAIKGLFSPNPLRRGIYIWFFYVTLKMILFDALETVLGRKRFEGVTGLMKLRKPKWYNT